MKVLVTGNLGYLGPLVVQILQQDGHVVHGVDTGMYLHQLAEPPAADMLPQRQYFGDIRGYPGGKGYDTVVHLAGLSNDPLGDLDADETIDVNVRGTVRMIDRYPDAHHVFASSASVYGASADTVGVGSPLAPQTEYAESKVATEICLRAAAPENHTILRLGTLFGWAPNFRTDIVVNRMCYDALYNRRITYTTAWRPLLHVAEAALAIVESLAGPRGTVDVVQASYRMDELAHIVAAAAPHFLALEESPDVDSRDYRVAPTIKAPPHHSVRDTAEKLMQRRLPFNIRLVAYMETR